MAACAAVPIANDDGSTGSAPVRLTSARASAGMLAWVQRSARACSDACVLPDGVAGLVHYSGRPAIFKAGLAMAADGEPRTGAIGCMISTFWSGAPRT